MTGNVIKYCNVRFEHTAELRVGVDDQGGNIPIPKKKLNITHVTTQLL